MMIWENPSRNCAATLKTLVKDQAFKTQHQPFSRWGVHKWNGKSRPLSGIASNRWTIPSPHFLRCKMFWLKNCNGFIFIVCWKTYRRQNLDWLTTWKRVTYSFSCGRRSAQLAAFATELKAVSVQMRGAHYESLRESRRFIKSRGLVRMLFLPEPLLFLVSRYSGFFQHSSWPGAMISADSVTSPSR